MQSFSRWFLVGGFTALSLLALPACMEGTTSSSTATAPTDAAGTTAPTPTVPATPATPTTPPRVALPPPAQTATAVPTPAIPAPPGAATSLLGTWESASCGARTYPRNITFADASAFSAEDLISPCPKGTACIWSGIVNSHGKYRVEKDAVSLLVDAPGPGPHNVQFPTRLTLDATGAPIETGSDGKTCTYKHAAATKRP
jgi:hypothetical protein